MEVDAQEVVLDQGVDAQEVAVDQDLEVVRGSRRSRSLEALEVDQDQDQDQDQGVVKNVEVDAQEVAVGLEVHRELVI